MPQPTQRLSSTTAVPQSRQRRVFGFQLLFGECSAEIAERFLRVLRGAAGGLLPGRRIKAVDGNACGGGVHCLIITVVTADDLRLAGMDVPVDGDCAFLSRGDRVNGKLRAGDNIAAGEYIGLARSGSSAETR